MLISPAKKWYDKINLRGYAQVRYNRLLETNPKLKCEQCDKSWGENGGFFMRRIRIVFFGNLSENVYFYIQPDFASSALATGLHFAQIRDAYFDIALDKKKEFRFRLGQSKVPYGFENMQSSQNRTALDRNDPLNSAVSNERDMGVFFYWAPAKTRQLFSRLVSSGLKGSGDYGVFAFGVYNGQTANRPEVNNSPHTVARLTYPLELPNKQIVEASIQAYQGEVGITKTNSTVKGPTQFLERRLAGSFIWYPQPFGIQAEYNIGEGPEYDPKDNTIKLQKLNGGYVQASYYLRLKGGKQLLIPFSRYQYYKGGKKHETDSRRHLVNELEIGMEWQPFQNFELVTMYTMSDRTFEDVLNPVNQQTGNLLRIQAQVNF
ncbi:MAG: porin [Saprospiraceae bacterium]|nr:porin [Saprospiraceae bacterium]